MTDFAAFLCGVASVLIAEMLVLIIATDWLRKKVDKEGDYETKEP